MTATPIPRSLTLTLYGDLDVSVIDERPPGRQPITTRVLYMSEWSKLDGLLKREIEAGRQAYVVAPLIEDSEKLELESANSAYERLLAQYPQFTIGLLHGRLSAEDKERIMRAFLDGVYDLLVATSVIEVGVDVPNATLMIVLHAERFGLSQLHQFRGRIGRGKDASYCYLLCDKTGRDGPRARFDPRNDGRRLRHRREGPGAARPRRVFGYAPGRGAAISPRRSAARSGFAAASPVRPRKRSGLRIRVCRAPNTPPCATNWPSSGRAVSR